MFETINEFWLDLLNNCTWERSHSWVLGGSQHWNFIKMLEGCKVIVYRRKGKPLSAFVIPNLIDMPKFQPHNIEQLPIIEKLQILAEWFCIEINNCYKVDVQYHNNNVSYIETDILPRE